MAAFVGEAQCRLGVVHEFGLGVAKDEARAAELYSDSAAQGNANAQCRLGTMYAYGRGVGKDEGRAFELYGKAAAQGHAAKMTCGGLAKHKQVATQRIVSARDAASFRRLSAFCPGSTRAVPRT